MKYQSLLIIIALFLLLGSSCKKDKLVNEIDKLPPASQTGANTFGCLVNGKAWIAERNDCSIICDPSFKIFYDGSNGGYIGIRALKINIKDNTDEEINLVFDSSNYKTVHNLTIFNHLITARFVNYSSINCNNYQHSADSTVIHIGQIVLTRYDLTNGILSGTFNFSITKPGCPTIVVIDGRFDKKL